MTKSAVRIYETKKDALSTYGKPIVAIPLNAVSKVERVMFNMADDQRMDSVDLKTKTLNSNLFELHLKDEFLPIYTNPGYTKIFKDTSVAFDVSPDKRRSIARKNGASPMRMSNTSTSKM